MTYRLLDVETEWPLVADEFTSRGKPMPNPAFAMIVGAFDEKTIHGFLVVQMQLHFEPIVLYTPAVIRGLVRAAEEETRTRFPAGTQYYSFAGNESVARICELMGGEAVPMQLFVKSIEQ